MNDPTEFNQTEPSMKKSSKKIFIGVIVVLLLFGVIGFFTYNHFTKNPTAIIKSIVDRAYEDFSKVLRENADKNLEFDIKNDSLLVEGNLKFDDRSYAGLDDEKIDFEVGLDYKSELAMTKLGLTKKGETLADILVQFQENRMLLKSSSMFDNVYDMGEYKFDEVFDFQDLENTQFHDVEEIDDVIRELKDAFLESLNDEEMSFSKERITIDGKDIAANKISYELDDKSIADMKTKIADKILNNEELIEKIARIFGKTSKQIKDDLKEIKGSNIEENLDGSFSIYTVGWAYKTVMVEFINGEERCYLSNYGDKAKIFFSDGEHEVNVDIVKEGEEYKIDIVSDGEDIASFIMSGDREHIILDYDIAINEIDLSGSLEIEIELNTNELFANVKLSAMGLLDKKTVDYDIELNYKLEVGKNLEHLDTKKALKDFTVGDSEKLMDKLEGLQNSAIFKYFTGSMSKIGGLI